MLSTWQSPTSIPIFSRRRPDQEITPWKHHCSPGENIVIRFSLFLPSSSVSPSLNLESPTTTPAHPLSCAARTFVAKSHPPRSISAMRYGFTGGSRRGSVVGGIQAFVATLPMPLERMPSPWVEESWRPSISSSPV